MRAYQGTPLTFAYGKTPAIVATHALDRIRTGCRYNVKGVLIARDVAHLYSGNNISNDTAFDGRGMVSKSRGDLAQLTRHADRIARGRHRFRTAD